MTQKNRKFLTSRQARRRYGGISDMTLWRWLRDKKMGFPKPRYINNRRYWDEDNLDEYDAQCLACAIDGEGQK